VYTAHFGLREAPFRATPDPRFFYSNAVYREAYATLLYGVTERKGFIAVTGEVGTGKTTLLRRLMDQLGPPVRFVLFYNTTLTFDETVELICGELGLAVDGLGRVQRLQRLNDLLIAEVRQGGNVVLLIDEAQNLDPGVLENLRLISNLETSTEKLLQIVLVGQPELDTKLADPALRQVAQRIAVRYRLEPLGADEVEAFIDYRLRLCGRTRQDLFRSDAIRRVAAFSHGVPRLINILCDGGLLAAYGAGTSQVTGKLIDEVALYLRLPRTDALRPRRLTRGLRRVAAGAAALAVAVASTALLSGAPLTGLLDRRVGSPAAGVGASPAAATAVAVPAAPPLVLPADGGGDAESHRTAPGWGTIVPSGTTVSEIAVQQYGRQHLLGLDLLEELNPHIVDLDHVVAGERLWIPAMTESTLARRQPDGSYHLTAAALTTPEAAERLAGRIRHRGYTARVAARNVTPGLRVHRVLVEELDGLEAAGHTWRMIQQLGSTPTSSHGAR
jgi:general secretion pathway protein A